MGAGIDSFLAGALAGLEPEPTLTVSEWADAYRLLTGKSSSTPGRWRTDTTPYSREIMDCLSTTSPIQLVAIMKGSQIGGTEILNNFVGYAVDHAPGPILYVLPDLALARDVSKHRLDPMFRETPTLRGRVRKSRRSDEEQEQSVLTKEFPGGYLKIVGANTPASFRHASIRYLLLDDVDGYPYEVGKEGDVVELALRRTATYRNTRKIVLNSTPTILDRSVIERYYRLTDMRQALVPCPHCGVYQTIEFERLDLQRAALRCIDCERLIDEAHKGEMLSHVVWTPTQESSNPLWRGYQISALYSPPGWYSWADAIEDFRTTAKSPKRRQVFYNTVLGQTFEDGAGKVDTESLMARAEKYSAEVPRETLLLTFGADVQDNRIEVEIVGWGADEQSWGIEYKVLPGDPTSRQVWDDLDAHLSRTWPCGKRRLRISCGLVDSGAFTKHVYRFASSRWRRRWFPSKGRHDAQREIAELSRHKARERRSPLVIVGTVQGRKLVYDRLKVADPTETGFCHFPVGHGYTKTYFDQLTSFRPVRRVDEKGIPYTEWHLAEGARKEPFDCRLYATAALYVLPTQDWDRLTARAAAVEEAKPEPTPDETVEPEPPPKAPGTRPRRRTGGGWVTGWK